MRKRRVVIFDDEDRRRESWVGKLGKVPGFTREFEARRIEKLEFTKDLEALRRRRKEARKGSESAQSGTFFDETDILFIDYDLFDLGEETGETGEEVAYLARCFSNCGMIIAVNQFAREAFAFDLSLRGHPESFADLNLLESQIFEPGLWSVPWTGFRPWYWPHLPKAVADFEQRVSEAVENLDEKIWKFLEIPQKTRELLPVSAFEFLSAKDSTFRGFIKKSRMALRPKDRILSDEATARIAAARLFKCMERLVLPGQDVLVDAAHLLERFPSLFQGDLPERLIGWPRVHELLDPGESVMAIGKIDNLRFARSAWLSRAAWYWPKVSECKEIEEVVHPWSPRPRLAFCEDISGFVHPDDAQEFVARVDSPFVRRFVSRRDLEYGPRHLFAL